MLSDKEKHFALGLARNSLKNYLETGTQLPLERQSLIEKFGKESELLKGQGCFVTLTTFAGDLRGCIGIIISDRPLYQNILKYAILAGTEDPRFNALSLAELARLQIEISALGAIVSMQNTDAIVVGKHGLIIKQGANQGLLLPQVALEWGWNKQEFLEHTCQKADLPKDAWNNKETEIYSFTAEVFSEKQLTN